MRSAARTTSAVSVVSLDQSEAARHSSNWSPPTSPPSMLTTRPNSSWRRTTWWSSTIPIGSSTPVRSKVSQQQGRRRALPAPTSTGSPTARSWNSGSKVTCLASCSNSASSPRQGREGSRSVLPGRLGLLILGCRVQGVAKVSERFGLPSAVAKLPVEGEASPQASERLLVPPLPGVDEAEVAEGVSLARSVSAGRRSAAPAAVGWHALAGPTVHEPAISYRVPAGAGGLGQQRREPLDPSVDGHVVDLNPSFNQQLLNVAVRQPEAQAPADREDDDVWWEAEAREGRPRGGSGTEAMRSHTGSLAARS